MLSEKELKKYSRQIVFSGIGTEGQEKLKKSEVCIVGIGGTGSAAALYLATAGVNLNLIDRDLVELSNLPRQILYKEADINQPKAIVARDKLQQMNPDIKIEAHVSDFNPRTAERLIGKANVVLDGTDNFETRYVLNEACVKKNIPFTYVGALRTQLMFSFFIPGKTACLRCLFPKKIPQGVLETCEIAGVLGPTAAIAGLLSATEALKFLAGFGDLFTNKLLYLDLTDFTLELIEIKKNPNCKICVQHHFVTLEEKIEGTKTISLCGRNTYQIIPARPIEAFDLVKYGENLKMNPEFNISVITDILIAMEYAGHSITLFRDGRLLIKNAKTEIEAKTIATRILSF
ncbi:MAG: ThiF family adenylyltransferase [Candidatus Heimdallarchaeota archaeon]